MTKSTMSHTTAKMIGKRIASLRKARGLSQRDVSGPGLCYSYVSRIENGARKPSLATLHYFAKKLGTSVEYLQTGKHAVVTLMLDDYAPYLAKHGLDQSQISFDEIELLGELTKKCCGKDGNPLNLAVKALLVQRGEIEVMISD